MKLLTKEILKKLPELYAHDGKDPKDIKVIVKFFDPCSQWTWYATEYSKEEKLFYGFVVGLDKELGYFNLCELENYTGIFGLGIERDLHFGYDKTLADVMGK